MKKRLLTILCIPAMLLGLTACGETPSSTTSGTTIPPTTEKPSTGAPTSQDPTTSAPNTSAPITSAPITSAPITSAPIDSTPVVKTAKEKHDEFRALPDKTDNITFEGTCVALEDYGAGRVNAYFQDGIYGYKANNIDLSLKPTIGKTYKVLGRKERAGILSVLNCITSTVSYASVTEISSIAKATINLNVDLATDELVQSEASFTDAVVKEIITATDRPGFVATINSVDYTCTYSSSMTIKAGMEEKLAGLVVGQKKTLKSSIIFSTTALTLLDPASIVLGVAPEKVTVSGVVSRDAAKVGGENLTYVVEGNEVKIGGATEKVAFYPATETSEKGNYIGLQIAKPVSDDIDLTKFALKVNDSTDLLNWDNVKNSDASAAVLKIKVATTDAIKLSIYWGGYTKDQVVNLAFVEGTTLEAEPLKVKEYHGLIEAVKNGDDLVGQVSGDTKLTAVVEGTVITFGGEGQKIDYFAPEGEDVKGNYVSVRINKPTDLVSTSETLVTFGGKEKASWSSLDELNNGYIDGYVLITNPEDVLSIKVSWTNDSVEETYSIKLAAGTSLVAKPVEVSKSIEITSTTFGDSLTSAYGDVTDSTSGFNFKGEKIKLYLTNVIFLQKTNTNDKTTGILYNTESFGKIVSIEGTFSKDVSVSAVVNIKFGDTAVTTLPTSYDCKSEKATKEGSFKLDSTTEGFVVDNKGFFLLTPGSSANLQLISLKVTYIK